jgi:hypothetical protein
METGHENYQKVMETTMKEWGARLDALKARADKATVDAKAELHKQIDEVTKLQENARKHFEDFRNTSQASFAEAKKEMEERWTKLTSAVDAFWEKIRS